MRYTLNILMAIYMSSAVSVASAECRDDLEYELMLDCIVVEGAGQSWEDYQQELSENEIVDAEGKKSEKFAQLNSILDK